MKIRVDLPDEDVQFLDECARTQGYASRSAVVRAAVRPLRASRLGDAYADAWKEWEDSGESEAREPVTNDRLS